MKYTECLERNNDNPALSIITASMNRTDHLRVSAERISRCSQHMEHIIVDWSSDPPITPKDLPNDNRVKLYRVSEEKYWNASRAYNFGFQMAKGTHILRSDADMLLSEDFFENNDWRENALCINNLNVDNVSIDGSLGGLFFTPLIRIIDSGGFNEYLTGWGYEDVELIARLRGFCDFQSLNTKGVQAIGHSDNERVRNTTDPMHTSKIMMQANSEKNKSLSCVLAWNSEIPRSRYKKTAMGNYVAIYVPKLPAQFLRYERYIKRKAYIQYYLGMQVDDCSYEAMKRMERFLRNTYYGSVFRCLTLPFRGLRRTLNLFLLVFGKVCCK